MGDLKTTVTIDVNEGAAIADIKKVQGELAATATQAAKVQAAVQETRLQDSTLGARLARLREGAGVNNLGSRYSQGGLFKRALGAAGLGGVTQIGRLAGPVGIGISAIQTAGNFFHNVKSGENVGAAAAFAPLQTAGGIAGGIAEAPAKIAHALGLISDSQLESVENEFSRIGQRIRDQFLTKQFRDDIEKIAQDAAKKAAEEEVRIRTSNEAILYEWALPASVTKDVRDDARRFQKAAAEKKLEEGRQAEEERKRGNAVGEGQ